MLEKLREVSSRSGAGLSTKRLLRSKHVSNQGQTSRSNGNIYGICASESIKHQGPSFANKTRLKIVMRKWKKLLFVSFKH